ncbi:hypothetical protein J6590_060968 [Homalodisca vitripennis]|nr:hypothetical protein J6590_060968 [Homalodisca vitripennis]
MSSATLEDDAVESDPRLLFIYTYLTKTTKFKVDKWQKMMNTEMYKTMIMDFLEKPQHSVLLVTLTSAGTLVPSLTFPTTGKTKSSYFARVKPEPITPENIRKCLIFGDVSPKPLEDLAVLVEEVFVPVFCNPANHKGWPAVVVEDVKRHVIELKNTVYKVRGQINGQTLLPMPDGVFKVHQVEQRIIESNGEDVDLQLKSAIEGAVIKWVNQITDVLQETSSIVFKSSENPLPFAEIEFWRSRVSNLECIYDQLRDPRVKKMASILELTDSAYYPSFRSIFRNVVAAVKEAKEISKYLKPLEKCLTKLEAVELTEAHSLLMSLLHMVCLVWSSCKYYCSSAKVINLLLLISNQIIDMGKLTSAED